MQAGGMRAPPSAFVLLSRAGCFTILSVRGAGVLRADVVPVGGGAGASRLQRRPLPAKSPIRPLRHGARPTEDRAEPRVPRSKKTAAGCSTGNAAGLLIREKHTAHKGAGMRV